MSYLTSKRFKFDVDKTRDPRIYVFTSKDPDFGLVMKEKFGGIAKQISSTQWEVQK